MSMITPQQIRGLLLEEAVLHLLRKSGYRTVDEPGSDPTLLRGGAGMFVRGRGGNHQIDAIADFVVHQPFSNPNRLLNEAKCYFRRDVRMPEIRNAVGVLKDVSEHWIPAPLPVIARKRYHYQFAMVSASGFSKDAQAYAFAQDVYLIPLGNSRFFAPILNAIRLATRSPFGPFQRIVADGGMRQLREIIRGSLRGYGANIDRSTEGNWDWLRLPPFIQACSTLNYTLLGVLGGQFPILLAPSARMRHGDIPDHVFVRIVWDQHGWYLRDERGRELFSFDLPLELLNLFSEQGVLSQERALSLKSEFMSFFQAVQTEGNRARVISFELDHNWFEQIRGRNR